MRVDRAATRQPSRCPNLAFPVNLTAGILDAVADRLLVNIQPDVMHIVLEEPPWLLSESTFPLSSAFPTPRAPPGLSIQTIWELPEEHKPSVGFESELG